MNQQTALIMIIGVPFIGAILAPLAGGLSVRLRNSISFLSVLISLAASIFLLPRVMSGEAFVFHPALPWGTWISFTVDSLAVFMAIASSAISAIIIFYSFGYMREYPYQNEYYSMVTLFLGSMMGIIFSSNLILLFIFWELTAIVSWRLIGFFRKENDMLRADKAFLITVFGALVMLMGFIMLYQQAGSFEFSRIQEALSGQVIPTMAMIFILFGILSKSATLPFHTWLPDAGVAPSPVTALLHAAVLVKIGVYVFARLFVATLPIAEIWHTVIPIIAGVSALVAAGAALIDTDIKRIIAYSTVSQIGFIFLGLAIDSSIGIIGGLLYILMHGIAKAGIFLCAGIIEHETHTKDITKMGGLLKTMPLTAISFLFCAFSVMGVPPFGGFFSKYWVFMGTINSGHIWISILFLLGAFLTIVYLLRLFALVFLGEPRTEGHEGSFTMVTSVVSLAVLSLIAGIGIYYPAQFAQTIMAQIGVAR